MESRLPLSTQLSQALVAFTIEFDNEFERQMPHRTTNHGRTAGAREGPWLVSMVMWWNCMRFVGEAGVRVGELEDLARTTTNLNGMERWGYVVVEPDPADHRAKPSRRDWMIRATAKGRKAQEVWAPLLGAIEQRWEARFGEDALARLREALLTLIHQFDFELPDCLPILGYGLFSKEPGLSGRAEHAGEDRKGSELALPALLSRALLAFAMEFESESDLSLAICANVLRVLDERGVLLRDLPLLTGVSKEAIRVALGVLEKKRIAVGEPDPEGSRAKIVRLTPNGQDAQDAYRQLLVSIEERWQQRYGKDTLRALRAALERVSSDLFRGLKPYSDGWRAEVRQPDTLPHYPMVLHRGGFPDGS